MNDSFKDYYKLLGVTPRASFENIRSAAEHELSQNWNNAMGRLEIQEAYEILSDPEKRKEYDEEFNKRLNEREMAIRNARTFEEYIAATSLYSELANTDLAPEVEVPQEEIDELENNNLNAEDVSKNDESVEEKVQEESPIDSVVVSDLGESNSGDVESSQDNEEEVVEEEVVEEEQEEVVQENETEQEKDQELEEKSQEVEEQEENKQEVQELEEELKQEFINIPIKRIEKEMEVDQQQLVEPAKDNQVGIDDEPLISKAAVRELIRYAIIAGGIAVGSLIIGWSFPGAVLGLMAGVATGDFFKKHADKIKFERKPKFQKESKQLEIKEINTQETQFLNEYSENLENEIYDLLDKPNKNYELEIAIRKYENLIELTKKRIDFKVNESEKKSSILKKMDIKALRDKLGRLNKTLEQLNEKKQMQQKKKDPKLSKINQKLSDISKQVLKVNDEQAEEKEFKKEILDDLMIKKSNLLEKRDAKANRLYVNKDLISLGQFTLVKINSAVNIVKSAVVKFTDLNTEEQIEESSAKSL